MAQLTPRQNQILHMIQEFIAEFGMPPTRAEIARELGFKSANAAEEHLRALQRKGVIELIPGASRGIQLKDSLREQLGLPLVGRVAAGSPILAEEHIVVPRPGSSREGDGWVIGTSLDFDRQVTQVAVFDAMHLSVGPLAIARLPSPLPLGFHGTFAPA